MKINRLLSGGQVFKPSHIVIHSIGEFVRPSSQDCVDLKIELKDYHAVEWLEILGYSYHTLITPSGDDVFCRGTGLKAWHAKAQGFNHKSLGLAFMVAGVYNLETLTKRIQNKYLEGKQEYAGIDIVSSWRYQFNILEKNVVKHSAIDPNKPDPGDGFPWEWFLKEVEKNIAE